MKYEANPWFTPGFHLSQPSTVSGGDSNFLPHSGGVTVAENVKDVHEWQKRVEGQRWWATCGAKQKKGESRELRKNYENSRHPHHPPKMSPHQQFPENGSFDPVHNKLRILRCKPNLAYLSRTWIFLKIVKTTPNLKASMWQKKQIEKTAYSMGENTLQTIYMIKG